MNNENNTTARQAGLIATMIDEWYFHADEHVKSKLADFSNVLLDRFAAHSAEARNGEGEKKMYVACYECSHCGHMGINDESGIESACGYPCGWHGPSPVEDKCPGCNREGTMTSACPECGSRYSVLAEIDLPVTGNAVHRTDARNGEGVALFQQRVNPWMLECFGAEISSDRIERNHRFFEEAAELVQANGMTRSEAHQLVDYTFDRPVGDLHQEVGGVMVTLAALCLASGADMHAAAETELARIWTKVEQIRAKQAAKPKHSPLPAAPAAPAPKLTDEELKSAKYLNEISGPSFLHGKFLAPINAVVRRLITMPVNGEDE